MRTRALIVNSGIERRDRGRRSGLTKGDEEQVTYNRSGICIDTSLRYLICSSSNSIGKLCVNR